RSRAGRLCLRNPEKKTEKTRRITQDRRYNLQFDRNFAPLYRSRCFSAHECVASVLILPAGAPMSTLDAVLSRIDQDIDQSVERLFALLRIASVSTDPAYKEHCRTAAEHVAADLRSIGFAADVRPTEGHPVVVGKSNG